MKCFMEEDGIANSNCEINNGKNVDLNIVFASQNNFHFTSHHSRFKNRTKQVRVSLLFNFHFQFTDKSVGSLWSPL